MGFLCKGKHSFKSSFETRSCDSIVFFGIRCIQTDGKCIDNRGKFRNNISSVLKIAKSVCINADFYTVFFFGIFCGCQKDVERTGRFSITAVNKLIITGKIKSIHGSFNLFQCRIFFVPEGLGITDTVFVTSDAEGASALICNVCVYLVFVCV